ncbi:MAG: AAA family ATPase, partial [Ruminococcus sp.]|nr:AAA family ATPase [Ruminococcus sp.]
MENQNQSKLKLINSAELMDMQLPPIRFTVADILPSGLTVFAGAPKVGKSLFILKLCLAVASGENFWCYPTRKGTVLYLALEDSMMRLQKRLC